MRERELKQADPASYFATCESLPMRERELKLDEQQVILDHLGRSPCGSVN